MRRLRACAAWRPDATRYRDPAVATRLSLKSLARRILALDEEIAALDRHIAPLVEELAPDLLALEGVGVASAGELMVAAGENPDRLRSEASFAMLCGACPLPASSGKTQRHRLNRGGNRQANSALHMIVVCRMRTDQRTRTYVERRTREGLSKREIIALPEALCGTRSLPRAHRAIARLTNMRASEVRSIRRSRSVQRCREAAVVQSIGSVGDAHDDAVSESFLATLECELLVGQSFRTTTEAPREVFSFIEGFYNTRRLHSALPLCQHR